MPSEHCCCHDDEEEGGGEEWLEIAVRGERKIGERDRRQQGTKWEKGEKWTKLDGYVYEKNIVAVKNRLKIATIHKQKLLEFAMLMSQFNWIEISKLMHFKKIENQNESFKNLEAKLNLLKLFGYQIDN